MKPIKFKTQLKKVGSWTIAAVSIDVFKIFGTNSHVRINGTIDGMPITAMALMPKGDGTHFMAINAQIRKAIRKNIGATVEICIWEKHTSVLEIPVELKEAFEASPEAKKLFDSYSYSYKRNYSKYISGGKRQETRDKRAADTVIKLERLYFEKHGKG